MTTVWRIEVASSNSRLGFHDIDDDSEAAERVARTTIAEQMKEGLVESPVSIFAEDVENQGSNVQNMAAGNEGETRKDALLTWDSRYHGKARRRNAACS